MIQFSRLKRRAAYLGSSLVLMLTGLTPAIMPGIASAQTQVDDRFIRISSSAAGANPTTYHVQWTPTSTTDIGGIVVDFCDGSTGPLIGEVCTIPTGFTVGTPTVTNQTGISGFTAGTLNSGRTLTLTNASAADMATLPTVSFDITTVTNPTDTDAGTGGTQVATFYARIITYAAAAGATGYDDETPGTHIEFGGVALSLANQLTITAKVQESLTFCVYITGANCAAASGSSLALGDGNGVLANAATTYVGNANFGVATNAQGGVIVRMKGNTLTSGSNTITPYGAGTSTTCVTNSTATTTEQFGLAVSTTGSVTAASTGGGHFADYNCDPGSGAADTHNFNTNATSGTASTYGGAIAFTAGALDETQVPMEFAAKSATATEAGVYTTTLMFIATATF